MLRSIPSPIGAIVAKLRADPSAWSDWLVLADWLVDRDDPRGVLVTLEHRLAVGALGADEARTVRAQADALIAEHRDAWLGSLDEPDACLIDWILAVTEGATRGWDRAAPDALSALPTHPTGWLVALLGLLDAGAAPTALRGHCDRIVAAVADRIARAFDGVPVPGEGHKTLYQAEASDNYDFCDRSRDHLGRWQDLPTAHIDDNQWALPHLDAHGIRYYLPALMCAELRSFLDAYLGLASSGGWIFESLGYTLQPGDRASDLREHGRDRLALLDPAQRAAICAFALVTQNDPAFDAWVRVVVAEAAGPRPDWFDRFWPPAEGA